MFFSGFITTTAKHDCDCLSGIKSFSPVRVDYVSYLRIQFTAASRLLCRFDEKCLYGEDEFFSPSSNYQCVFQGARGAAGIPGKKGEQGPKVTS